MKHWFRLTTAVIILVVSWAYLWWAGGVGR